jgi:hypothetical protein
MLGPLCHTDIGSKQAALIGAARATEDTRIVAPAPQKGKFDAFEALK